MKNKKPQLDNKPVRLIVEDTWDFSVDGPLGTVVGFTFCPAVTKLLTDLERTNLLDARLLPAAKEKNMFKLKYY